MGQNIMIYSPTWDKLITVEQSKLQGGGGTGRQSTVANALWEE